MRDFSFMDKVQAASKIAGSHALTEYINVLHKTSASQREQT